jgi:hypothetical protein
MKERAARTIIWLGIAIVAILAWPLTLLYVLVLGICGVGWIHGRLEDCIFAAMFDARKSEQK